MFSRIGLCLILVVVGLGTTFAQNDTSTTTTITTTTAATTTTTTTPAPSTPAPTPPANVCELKNGTNCDECLKNVSCLWCIKTKSCVTYPVATILPPHSLCPLNEARWGQCSINFQTLIIAMAVVGGVIILAFFICLFCCCKCENLGSSRFESKMQRQADKRKGKSDTRKAEMRTRHDEIRQKYGLSRASPYARFENN
ncbi:PTTG1 interacting protein a [Alosa sapidissima]|uniref:PTTG1 interacting protein a n=1 Tax=Alosa sapidissima TaxID=34773 RepID=UPI001C09C879|nr:PTTG1 interacting protein a [Alosa sapidissima]